MLANCFYLQKDICTCLHSSSTIYTQTRLSSWNRGKNEQRHIIVITSKPSYYRHVSASRKKRFRSNHYYFLNTYIYGFYILQGEANFFLPKLCEIQKLRLHHFIISVNDYHHNTGVTYISGHYNIFLFMIFYSTIFKIHENVNIS